jgi:protein tyrosine phosphatase
VRQYHFLSWPDRKFPDSEKLYDFITMIRQNTNKLDNKGPVVVHCRYIKRKQKNIILF